jgi:hypothetical protein
VTEVFKRKGSVALVPANKRHPTCLSSKRTSDENFTWKLLQLLADLKMICLSSARILHQKRQKAIPCMDETPENIFREISNV